MIEEVTLPEIVHKLKELNQWGKYMWKRIPVEYNEDGTIKHINKEGTRYHVLSYDSMGGLMYF